MCLRESERKAMSAETTMPAAVPPATEPARGIVATGRLTRGPAATPAESLRLRRLWLKVHRWLGLQAGLLFVLLGLTGSLLVFDHAIDEWLNPDLLLTDAPGRPHSTDGTGRPHSIDELVTVAERAFGLESHAQSISTPRVPTGVWTVWFASGTEDTKTFTAVYVDSDRLAVTGQRVWGQFLMSWMYRLHYQLVAGEIGATIVGIAGLLLLVSIASGFVLWWPLWRHSLRAAFAVRRGRRTFDLHKTCGIASAVFLTVIAGTGVYLEFPNWIKPLVTVFSPETLPLPDLTSHLSRPAVSINCEQAVAIALARFPAATFDHLHPPQEIDGVYEIALRQPNEVGQSHGRTQVHIDRYSGKIIAVRDPTTGTAADAFLAWQFPLHNGEAFGLFGRWLVFATGLTPAFLYATGGLMWWRRHQSRQRQRNRGHMTSVVGRLL